MFEISPETLALLIPIIAVLGGITLAIVGIIMNGRKEELQQKERLLAMEKGISIPEPPRIEKQRRPIYLTMRAWGLVLTFIGFVVFLGIWTSDELRHAVWGLVPSALGLALLLGAWFERKEAGR
jgi:hypothetical protein